MNILSKSILSSILSMFIAASAMAECSSGNCPWGSYNRNYSRGADYGYPSHNGGQREYAYPNGGRGYYNDFEKPSYGNQSFPNNQGQFRGGYESMNHQGYEQNPANEGHYYNQNMEGRNFGRGYSDQSYNMMSDSADQSYTQDANGSYTNDQHNQNSTFPTNATNQANGMNSQTKTANPNNR